MAYQIIGNLVDIGPMQVIKEGFRKREIMIEVEKSTKKREFTYPVKLQAINTIASLFDGMDLQEALRNHLQVNVSFEISGRWWIDKNKNKTCFNSLDIQFISIIGSQQPQPRQQTINGTLLDHDIAEMFPASPMDVKDMFPEISRPTYIAPDAEHVKDDLPF